MLPSCDRAAQTVPQTSGFCFAALRTPATQIALQFADFRSSAGRFVPVETAGIEPASAAACEVASTSVAGALISPSTRLAGRVIEGQLLKVSSDQPERSDLSKPAS